MGADTRRSIAPVDPNVYIDTLARRPRARAGAGIPRRPSKTLTSFSAFPSSATLLRPIDSLLPRASRAYGGKARNLAALVRAGFPVPLAYALSGEASARTFERVLPEQLRPAQIFSRPFVSELELLEARERVLNAGFDAQLEDELLRGFEALRAAAADSVAVRSSSAVEDLSAASAAGLHTSVLAVASESALLDAVRRCFAHVFSPRVARYLQTLG